MTAATGKNLPGREDPGRSKLPSSKKWNRLIIGVVLFCLVSISMYLLFQMSLCESLWVKFLYKLLLVLYQLFFTVSEKNALLNFFSPNNHNRLSLKNKNNYCCPSRFMNLCNTSEYSSHPAIRCSLYTLTMTTSDSSQAWHQDNQLEPRKPSGRALQKSDVQRQARIELRSSFCVRLGRHSSWTFIYLFFQCL